MQMLKNRSKVIIMWKVTAQKQRKKERKQPTAPKRGEKAGETE